MKVRSLLQFLRCVLVSAWFVATLAQASPVPRFGAEINRGTVRIPGLVEASGVIASSTNRHVLWTHNDKGGQPRVFALSDEGRWLGTYRLLGAQHIDFEDIAQGVGPRDGVSYLYVGDIGDKTKNPVRSAITVYRFPEPVVYSMLREDPREWEVDHVEALRLRYPDGARNAEAMTIDPVTGELFILSKSSGTTSIYSATQDQLNAGGLIVLQRRGTFRFHVANGMDVSPDGREIVVRQEGYARLWQRRTGESLPLSLQREPIVIPVVGTPREKNGEAIGFAADGSGYFTLSDSLSVQPLYFFPRIEPSKLGRTSVLVAAGSEWNYQDEGRKIEIGWLGLNFKVDDWKRGEAPFGYGGAQRTLINYGATAQFRRQFSSESVRAGARLKLRLRFGDGVVVYLNGHAVVSENVPEDVNAEALALEEREVIAGWREFAFDSTLLQEGDNVLAISVHQARSQGEFLSVDAELVLEESAIAPKIRSIGRDDSGLVLQVEGEGDVLILQGSFDLEEWRDLGFVTLENCQGQVVVPVEVEQRSGFYRVRNPSR